MFVFRVSMLLLWTLEVLTTAEPLCDPETQYLLNGECCQKCKPGTSMTSRDCRNPVCLDCDEGEYMETYNTEKICKRQPHCDPNSHFQWPESTSKTERHQCQCVQGFHCSTATCFTCSPHTQCDQGYGATITGDQTHDTKCEKCPNGTFSDERSWNGTCKKKTRCPYGAISKDGNSESDNECATESHHVGTIIAVVISLAVLAGVAVAVYRWRRKGKTGHEQHKKLPSEDEWIAPNDQRDASDTLKLPIKVEDKEDEEKRNRSIIDNPTDDVESPRYPLQETTFSSGPPEEMEDVVLTVNGDVLSQDEKEHVISQPETQAITIT